MNLVKVCGEGLEELSAAAKRALISGPICSLYTFGEDLRHGA
jgi:hypothetical protein